MAKRLAQQSNANSESEEEEEEVPLKRAKAQQSNANSESEEEEEVPLKRAKTEMLRGKVTGPSTSHVPTDDVDETDERREDFRRDIQVDRRFTQVNRKIIKLNKQMTASYSAIKKCEQQLDEQAATLRELTTLWAELQKETTETAQQSNANEEFDSSEEEVPLKLAKAQQSNANEEFDSSEEEVPLKLAKTEMLRGKVTGPSTSHVPTVQYHNKKMWKIFGKVKKCKALSVNPKKWCIGCKNRKKCVRWPDA